MQKIILSTFISALLLPLVITRSSADENGYGRGFNDRDHHRDQRLDRQDGYRGDIRQFREHDMVLWRGGHWYHGRHGGRGGWWWIVGGIWYFYPAPVYPYPDPYQPPVSEIMPPQGPAQYWYYCNDPRGYYPYVAQCQTRWQAVPAGMQAGPQQR